VVGGSSDCRNFLHAFVWEEGGPMLDLNTLIAPGSGWQLTNAFNINDRGEILAKAAPVGFTPNDDEDLGHLVLLVPCDEGSESSCGVDGPGPATTSLQSKALNHRGGTDSTPRARQEQRRPKTMWPPGAPDSPSSIAFPGFGNDSVHGKVCS
jgi:probable HAF family extracellular repeat protein